MTHVDELNRRTAQLVRDNIKEGFGTERLLFRSGFAASRLEGEKAKAEDGGAGREEHGFAGCGGEEAQFVETAR
jgi:hypothetical protein